MRLRHAAVSLLCSLAACAAFAQSPQSESDSKDVVAVLTRMLDEDWHPPSNDAVWLNVRPWLDAEFVEHPFGPIAALARRAAVRVEAVAVRNFSDLASLTIDTRPWFVLGTPIPYFVEIYAAIDGSAPFVLAAAFSDAQCHEGNGAIVWPQHIPLGVHRVQLSLDVAWLRPMPTSPALRCAFSTKEMNPASEGWPRVGSSFVIAREGRALPAISFVSFDAHDGDPFIGAVKRAPASLIDDRLPSVRLGSWFKSAIAVSGDVGWLSDFCNEREHLLWHPGESQTDQQYWPAPAAARRRKREWCTTALAHRHSRTIGVRVVVAEVLEDAGDWQFVQPRLYEAFIDGAANTMKCHVGRSTTHDGRTGRILAAG